MDAEYMAEAERARALLAEVRRLSHREPGTLRKVVALAGPIGAGKSLVAEMLPALHLQWADPLYAGLAAMIGVDQSHLRDRTTKEEVIPWLGVSPRFLLRTLGTEWGRDLVGPDLWVRLTEQRIWRAVNAGHENFAICGTRFPNEVEMVRRLGGEVWWVTRRLDAGAVVHRSDAMLVEADCDRTIENTGTIDDLRVVVSEAWAASKEVSDAVAVVNGETDRQA